MDAETRHQKTRLCLDIGRLWNFKATANPRRGAAPADLFVWGDQNGVRGSDLGLSEPVRLPMLDISILQYRWGKGAQPRPHRDLRLHLQVAGEPAPAGDPRRRQAGEIVSA